MAVIKGALCFVPAFLFSLPFTVMWARRQCPGEPQCVLIAFIPGFYIGVAFAIVCIAWLLVKVNSRMRALKYSESLAAQQRSRDTEPGHVSDF